MKKSIIIAVLLLFTGLSLTAQKNSKSFLNIDYKEWRNLPRINPKILQR